MHTEFEQNKLSTVKKKIKFSRLRKSVSKANFWSSLKQTFIEKSVPLEENQIGVRKIDILTHSDKKSGAAAPELLLLS